MIDDTPLRMTCKSKFAVMHGICSPGEQVVRVANEKTEVFDRVDRDHQR